VLHSVPRQGLRVTLRSRCPLTICGRQSKEWWTDRPLPRVLVLLTMTNKKSFAGIPWYAFKKSGSD